MKRNLICIITIMLLSCTSLIAQNLLYRVEPGDTYESISKEFGVSVEALKSVNPNVKTLFVGMKINIPEKAEQTVPLTSAATKASEIQELSTQSASKTEYTTENKEISTNTNDYTYTQSSTIAYSKFGGGMLFNEGDLVKNAFFFEYSLGARTHLMNPLFIEYGLGYLIDSNSVIEKDYRSESTSHSLRAPLLVGVSLGEDLGVNFYFGPYLDFTVASKTEMTIFGETQVTRLRDIENYNRFQLGLKFGGEFNIYGCKVGACYSFGLTNHIKGIEESGSRLLIYLAF